MRYSYVGCHAVFVAFLATSGVGRATILTFDQIRIGGVPSPTISGNSVPQDYGDNVSGSPMAVPGGFFTYGEAGEGFTPEVLAAYFTGTANPGGSLWEDSYGDLANVLFGSNNSLSLHVQFTANPGFDVPLYSFDLGGWNRTDYTIDSVQVLAGAATLFSQSNVLVQGDLSGPGHTSLVFGSPLTGPDLEIVIDYGNLPGGSQDNIGIDNIRFGQDPPPLSAIPEPATIWLLLGAGAVWGISRRRKGVG